MGHPGHNKEGKPIFDYIIEGMGYTAIVLPTYKITSTTNQKANEGGSETDWYKAEQNPSQTSSNYEINSSNQPKSKEYRITADSWLENKTRYLTKPAMHTPALSKLELTVSGAKAKPQNSLNSIMGYNSYVKNYGGYDPERWMQYVLSQISDSNKTQEPTKDHRTFPESTHTNRLGAIIDIEMRKPPADINVMPHQEEPCQQKELKNIFSYEKKKEEKRTLKKSIFQKKLIFSPIGL